MVVRSSAGTSRKAVAEIVKEDLRRVYSLADDAVRHGNDTIQMRDRYVLVFHDNTGVSPNAFEIVKGTWNGTAHVETEVTPDKREANRIVAGTKWIRPSASSDIQIVVPDPQGGEYRLIFQSRGI